MDDPFAGAYLDRRAEARQRAGWLEEALADPATRYLAMWQGAVLMRAVEEGSHRLTLLPREDRRIAAINDPEQLVLLGWYQGQRCLLADLPEALAVAGSGERFAELRPLAAELPAGEAGLVAYARALHLWRGNHRFCGRCGAPLSSRRAGHARHCAACHLDSFPRLDPAIIVLVCDGDRALLGRQSGWPPGRFSTIAGFVEPGESLEDAVRREVWEETGTSVQEVAYHSSQPWPFPASLMLGFTARASVSTPVLHDGELEEAHWFTRGQVAGGAVRLPPPEAISRRLIDAWLQGGEAAGIP
ncbi:MAG TPA: NAD(+) diphosphatase [Steroidobacteraceae bacterium]|nr:NAD(+) diphosphatase [Steroidobacteraceae bacterium]